MSESMLMPEGDVRIKVFSDALADALITQIPSLTQAERTMLSSAIGAATAMFLASPVAGSTGCQICGRPI
jgi:hypothetical protein